MSKNGPLILVDDDNDDQELMIFTLEELGVKNKVITFNTAESALSFLYQTKEEPFLIISDINMPKMDGIAFKKKIDSCSILNSRSIPFVFVSTCTNGIPEARELNIQGYFQKSNSMEQLAKTMDAIVTYWNLTQHKN